MPKPSLSSTKLFLSNVFLAIGLGIVFFLLLFYYQQLVSTWLLNNQRLIPLPTTQLPHVALPPVTSTPWPTATPLPPTATPELQIPVRLAIPKIELNTAIVETGVELVEWLEGPALRWQTPDYAVGHRETSARPGERGNMVLSGHNNTAGSVFLRLSELAPGDEITVYTADETYLYQVVSSEIVLWTGADAGELARHFELGGDTADEALTLISCWPYATYTHRIYVRAKPVSKLDLPQ